MPYTAVINSRTLHIVFASSEPETANKMLVHIREYLPNYHLSVAALFFGQQASVDLNKFCMPVSCIGLYEEYLSIAESRNICQIHLQKLIRSHGGLGLILDDDLRWIMPEDEFMAICDQLMSKGCDMAFCALEGDAPVPKEYTRASPLLDTLLVIEGKDDSEAARKITDFINKIKIAGNIDSEINSHHDYYAYDINNFYRAFIDIESLYWKDFLARLYVGKTTTRPVRCPSQIVVATGRERGGATIIFNSAVLDHPNQAIQCDGFISRRSDMVMAASAKHAGLSLFNTPAVLSHNRSDTFDSHDCRKLIGDILGYALIESYMSGSYAVDAFSNTLSHRLVKTLDILKETTVMLTLLRDWLKQQQAIDSESKIIIEKMITENSETIVAVQTVDLKKVVSAFEYFSMESFACEELSSVSRNCYQHKNS